MKEVLTLDYSINPLKMNRLYFQTLYVFALLIALAMNIVMQYLDPVHNWTHWFWDITGTVTILILRPPATAWAFFRSAAIGYIFGIVLTPFVLPFANKWLASVPDMGKRILSADDLAYFVMGFVGYQLGEAFAKLLDLLVNLIVRFFDWVKERPARLWEWYLKIKNALNKIDKEKNDL